VMLSKKIVLLDRNDHLDDVRYFAVEFLKCKMRTYPSAWPELTQVEVYDILTEHEYKELNEYIMSSATSPYAGYWELSNA
jgi:hypothetical protein